MKWRGNRKSSNVDNRRGASSSSGSGGRLSPMFIGLILKLVTSKKGLLVVGVVVALFYFTSTNPLNSLTRNTNNQIQSSASYKETTEEKDFVDLTKRVLISTEDIWHQLMPNYKAPTLVLFIGSVSFASAYSATRPFYCRSAAKLYIDLSIFQEMSRKLNAPGDFAHAYVIAHEVGHHIQDITEINKQVRQPRSKVSQREYNKYSVKLELQADFYAGVWAHHAQKTALILEPGDLQEALNAAHAIGDHRL